MCFSMYNIHWKGVEADIDGWINRWMNELMYGIDEWMILSVLVILEEVD